MKDLGDSSVPNRLSAELTPRVQIPHLTSRTGHCLSSDTRSRNTVYRYLQTLCVKYAQDKCHFCVHEGSVPIVPHRYTEIAQTWETDTI